MLSNKNITISLLVVEDDPIQARLVAMAMEEEGYRIDFAITGEEALEKVKSTKPNIVILDLNLPDMDGLEIIERLKKPIIEESIRIVVYSSEDTNSTVLKALSMGASDYAFKKDDPAILLARVANIARNILLNHKLNHNISIMEKDLMMAREVQLSVIPKPDSHSDSFLDFNALYLPADYVSGDIYDIYKFNDHKYRIFLADATGHGIQAGYITMSIKTEYDRLKKIHSNLGDIISGLNSAIFNTFSDLTLYTCIIVDIDTDSLQLTYSSSGHPSQYLIQDEKSIELTTTNPIVGFKHNLPVKTKTLPLDPNFRLHLFSDGIYEFMDENNELFGIERYEQYLWDIRNIPMEEVSFQTLSKILDISSQEGFDDDVTLLTIGFK